MNIDFAWRAIAIAGRELGSGPAAVLVEPPFDDLVEQLTSKGCTPDNAGSIALGIAIGMVASHERTALEALVRVEAQWRDPRWCESHISCPDHDGALFGCGRKLEHKGWHVGYGSSAFDVAHRWNDDGRIEHL